MGGIIISKLDNRRKNNSSSTHRLPTFLLKYCKVNVASPTVTIIGEMETC